jgi:hypothetical protein
MPDSKIAEENVQAYSALYLLEVGLREFIISALGDQPKSWNRLLPGDILAKYRAARAAERSAPWVLLCPHHPLYYVDFPDLRKVIERDDNWRAIFEPVFGDKSVICSTLRRLEPIRNSVAHNRKLSSTAVHEVNQAVDQISACIGPIRFEQLVRSQTTAEDAAETLAGLKVEFEHFRDSFATVSPIQDSGRWCAVDNWWWLDSEYLGHSVDRVYAACALLSEYAAMPRHRGTGHIIQEWVSTHFVVKVLDDAIAELCAILANGVLR